MEMLQNDSVLEYHADTLEAVRKCFGLEKPGYMSTAVDILDTWVKQQHHFVKKDFSRHYLEVNIIMAKGSIERAKQRLDHMCTLRTLMPHFTGAFDIKKDYETVFDTKGQASVQRCQPMMMIGLPKLTKEHDRVILFKLSGNKFNNKFILTSLRYLFMACEYFQEYGYSKSLIGVVDYTELDFVAILSVLNFELLRQSAALFMKGYAPRIKEIHFVSKSKMLDVVINTIFKNLVSAKISGRVHAHETMETVFKFVPIELFPKDYGGKEGRTFSELNNNFLDVLNSTNVKKYLRDMTKATSDESHRHVAKFNEMYMGMPGTFRTLNVD